MLEAAGRDHTGGGNRDLDLGGRALTIRSQNGDPALCILDVEGSMGDIRAPASAHTSILHSLLYSTACLSKVNYIMKIPKRIQPLI